MASDPEITLNQAIDIVQDRRMVYQFKYTLALRDRSTVDIARFSKEVFRCDELVSNLNIIISDLERENYDG